MIPTTSTNVKNKVHKHQLGDLSVYRSSLFLLQRSHAQALPWHYYYCDPPSFELPTPVVPSVAEREWLVVGVEVRRRCCGCDDRSCLSLAQGSLNSPPGSPFIALGADRRYVCIPGSCAALRSIVVGVLSAAACRHRRQCVGGGAVQSYWRSSSCDRP